MHKQQWHKVCTAVLLESGGQAMSEVRLQTAAANCGVNSTCYFACSCWSSAPRNTLGTSSFVGAVYKDILRQTSCWSVSSTQHAPCSAVLCHYRSYTKCCLHTCFAPALSTTWKFLTDNRMPLGHMRMPRVRTWKKYDSGNNQGSRRLLITEPFILTAVKKHGNLYSYDKVIFKLKKGAI